tara:strand:+ start:8410 stop:8988 length:579 start_codon:yes stop_codon:yes gene_type:complete
LDRRDIHLVDWNNDGACDIAWVDPNNNNRVSVWLNNYKTTGSFATWTYLANPAPVLNCPEKRGVGIHDLPVRFADISNNKMSDYVCIQPDGRFYGWTHNIDGSWERIAQFKKAEGIDRANIRFGNVNGRDGEDMIWVDKVCTRRLLLSIFMYLLTTSPLTVQWRRHCIYQQRQNGHWRQQLVVLKQRKTIRR